MQNSPFDRFIDLIKFDQELHKKEQEIINLEGEAELIEDQIAIVGKPLETQKIAVHDLRKEVDAQELEMRTLDQKEQEVKTRFSSAHNAKEYQALKTEVEQLQKAQLDGEDTLIAAWNKLESAQKKLEVLEKEFQEQSIELEKQLAEKQKQVDELEAQFQEASKGRAGKEQNIPEEWLANYARMQNSVSDPVAEVNGTSCSACFQTIPNQMMLHLSRKKLLQCKGCYRFLYLDYSQDKASDTAKDTENGG